MIELKDITGEILFEESAHTYTRLYDGKPLCGVTTMLRDMGLAADYADIDPDVLARAADRGHLVHALCDRTDETGEPITEFDELEIYHRLKEKGIVTRLEEPTGMYEAMVEASHNDFLITNYRALTSFMDTYVKSMRRRIIQGMESRNELEMSHRLLAEGMAEGNLEKGLRGLRRHFEYIERYK